MVTNIVTGKPQEAGAVSRRQEGGNRRLFFLRSAVCRLPPGFTLLELMIVITIIIILAAVVLPQYQKTILATREAVLRDDLFKLRSLLDQYAADKQKLPGGLEDLVTEKYLRELPNDPITGKPDWVPVPGDDPNSTTGESGIVDVHSGAEEASSDGSAYSSW